MCVYRSPPTGAPVRVDTAAEVNPLPAVQTHSFINAFNKEAVLKRADSPDPLVHFFTLKKKEIKI